ncbi:glycosyltransferase [Pelagicoccus sp. NFK12]|uniref:Glycosyltransferase n=1 Tax=Pelagicoccus enzymogenes TaxID=2773457 RepID=A0A927FA37_9BACT|nr:glycosyltransferase [Pelagicoccus enzymogenes]MBD5780536.1 glycosyltransferase [Pelagicoccus enzymogenes]
MRVLIIGKIWPEPTSSAAGTRTLDLIRSLKLTDWEIHFACAAQQSEHSCDLEATFSIRTHDIELNDSSFDNWVAKLAPDIVIFDRYMTEEQFGWRVAKSLPESLRVIDTSDLHCLREARRQSLKSAQPLSLGNQVALREIAALLRVDLSLIISEFEIETLAQHFPVPAENLAYWPFALPKPPKTFAAFDERKDFVMIGSFLHEPNWDAVQFCHREIWPLIRQKLPQAQLDIYGSYLPEKAKQLHSEKSGFRVLGRARDSIQTLSNYRVNLAPLRFGAGLKGKLADAFLAGTPSIASPIAVEGMQGTLDWGSLVSIDPLQFSETAAEIYASPQAWSHAQTCGLKIAEERFPESHWLPKLPEILQKAHDRRHETRSANFVGQLLNHHQHRSTEFMSRWIEAKNRTKTPGTSKG